MYIGILEPQAHLCILYIDYTYKHVYMYIRNIYTYKHVYMYIRNSGSSMYICIHAYLGIYDGCL